MAISLLACQFPKPPSQPRPPSPPRSRPQPHLPSTPASVPDSLADTIDGSDASRYPFAVGRIFAEGLQLYDNGEYAAAIRKFQSPELSNAWPELRVRSFKYLAFSYCVTNQLQACQKAFHDALQIDPQFKLRPEEKDHPIWGPVFQKAQSESSTQPSPPQQSGMRHSTRY